MTQPWQTAWRKPEPVKRKFSNFLTLPTSHYVPTASADASKPGTEHFDLSSDEEDVPEKFRSQPASSSSVYGTPTNDQSPDQDEEAFYRSRLTETEERKSSTSLSDAESNRKDSIVSDSKFDLILASLQGPTL